MTAGDAGRKGCIVTAVITCPDGMTGLAVAPWSPEDWYAVAANWANAACSVYSLSEGGGPDEYVWENTGRQVADFRHCCSLALRAQLLEAVTSGGDDPDDVDFTAILSEAIEVAART